ncbi:hypothetical protein NDU88_001290 [Pleurodeles waltl]|uniref:Uncharacterized protein n=1 Tax=Pleurodeles waltl TaxID=8319 RepID=A0AAV7VVZ6_PLEWA|nr:hypothetical protein NDU88_001290 [Pleurodeles waltl]
MLAWLLRRERPIPIIQMLCSSSGEKTLGQLRVNSYLREHLQNIYASPWSVGVTWIQEYLDGLQMPRLTEAQTEELEGEVSLDDLVEALGDLCPVVPPIPLVLWLRACFTELGRLEPSRMQFWPLHALRQTPSWVLPLDRAFQPELRHRTPHALEEGDTVPALQDCCASPDPARALAPSTMIILTARGIWLLPGKREKTFKSTAVPFLFPVQLGTFVSAREQGNDYIVLLYPNTRANLERKVMANNILTG